MKLPSFEYHAPGTLEECAELIETFGKEAQVAAGGTDLFVRMKIGLVAPSHIIALSTIKGIDLFSDEGEEGLVLGAGTRLSTLITSPLIRQRYPALSSAASLVATTQIRNRATLGGNILQETRCFYYNRSASWRKAVPACVKRGGKICHVVPHSTKCFAVYQGDLAPLLIALGSRAILFSKGNRIETGLEDLFRSDGKSPFVDRGPILLAGVRIPAPEEGGYGAYRKYRLREGIDFPLAGVAVALHRRGGKIEGIRICLTGVASSPVLVKKAGAVALGNKLTAELIAHLAGAALSAAHPVANLEGAPTRRRSMIRLMTEEILAEAAASVA